MASISAIGSFSIGKVNYCTKMWHRPKIPICFYERSSRFSDASCHVDCKPGFDRRDVLLVLSSVGLLAPAFWKSSSKDGVALASEFADMPALRGKDYGKTKNADLRVGSGPTPKVGETVVVDWDGFTIGYYGRIFEARNKTKGGSFEGDDKEFYKFRIGSQQVIPAFEEAVSGMALGGIRRCLDKAALQLKEDGTQSKPVAALHRDTIQQAYTLNTHISHLKLPVTCMPVFPGLSIFLLLSLYYLIFVPLCRRITGHPHGASQLQRVGIGLAVSIVSVAWAGVFERYRRHYAIEHGYEFSFLSAMHDLSAYWLLIQYCLIGIAEVFCIVGLLEFLYEEAPDAMRSIGSAYAAVAGGLGCFAATILNNIIKSATGNDKEGRHSWLSQNINTGRFDYLYWLLTGLSVINFCAFLYAARRYQYRAKQETEMEVTSKSALQSEDN
ncbi:major facilitator superfamily protein [Actinidia rufa]|uniref:peptidylprolyl isomerase n=1 Tax=Actinidia rufa TaxID=165716 RepID=A0A7J0HDE7_9ERIC|nr:major facilitator superfamily protein [Actinidia rufa]